MNYADRAMVVSSDHGFLHWKQQATILRGWAMAELGEIDEGLKQMRAGLEGYEAMDSWLASCWFRSLLATAYAKAGRLEAALRALDGALAVAKRTGDHFFLAEVYRLQGETTFAQGGLAVADDVEELFRRSMELARQQSALAWELRSAVSLARLWRDAGKREQAAELLVPVTAQFAEGFRTPDLKEAWNLMEELGVNPSRQHPWADQTGLHRAG